MAFTEPQSIPSVTVNSTSSNNASKTYASYTTSTTKKKKKSKTIVVIDSSDPYDLVSAKTTAGKKAVFDGGLGHFKKQ